MTPAALARLHAAAFVRPRPWTAAEFADLLASPHAHLTAHGQGFALWRAVAGEAELLTIAVAPEAQRQGIGRALMTDLMAAAGTYAETIYLEVAVDNTPAIALYHACGLVEVGRRKAYFRDEDRGDIDALVMRASLSQGQGGESGERAPKSG